MLLIRFDMYWFRKFTKLKLIKIEILFTKQYFNLKWNKQIRRKKMPPSSLNINILTIGVVTVSTLIILVNSILYSKLILFDGKNKLQIYLKWINPFILFLQCLYFYFINRSLQVKLMTKTTGLYAISLIFCMFGDIFIIYQNTVCLIIAMTFFGISYIILSIDKFDIIETQTGTVKNFFAFMGLIIIYLGNIAPLSFVCFFSISNGKITNIFVVLYTCFYIIIMTNTLGNNFIYAINNFNIRWILSFIGILLFVLSDWMIIFGIYIESNTVVESLPILIYWLGISCISWSCITFYKN